MKIANASVQFETEQDVESLRNAAKKIERIGRVCYKSEDKLKDNSADKFVTSALRMGHHSIIEHVNVSVRIICDRGVTHEIVRHRLGSYSQESTIYCNYTQDKFGNEISCIKPFFFEKGTEKYKSWVDAMLCAETAYFELISLGCTPAMARSVLPNALKTEIVCTYNIREWRHFFKQRTSGNDHPQIRQIAFTLIGMFKTEAPVLFEDFSNVEWLQSRNEFVQILNPSWEGR